MKDLSNNINIYNNSIYKNIYNNIYNNSYGNNREN